MVVNILLILAAYLLGSIPNAVWIGRRFYGIDVREHGSHNAGATNTLRVLGARAAVPVFALDVAKGFAAVMFSHLSIYPNDSHEIFNLKIVLVAAVTLGHILPLFAGFKGGKGVATLTGAVLALYPPAVLLCLAVWALIFFTTHYVSLSSVCAGIVFPIFVIWLFGERAPSLMVFSCVITVLLIFTHRKNIRRLSNGTESKTYLFRRRKEARSRY